jgi:hypothetical protein
MTPESKTSIEQVRGYFRNFAEYQAPRVGSPLYENLCWGVLGDPEMVALAARSPPSQPSANLLLAAVHSLLLGGIQHPLREFYPDVVAGERAPREPSEATYPLFRDFVRQHEDQVAELIQTRLVQTNVVRRTTCLLPAFDSVARQGGGLPLSIIEVGASAGLNLRWDRYHHRYETARGVLLEWGDPSSTVQLSAELRGTDRLPEISPDLRVTWRIGIDLNPVDVDDPDAMLWLRALVFPEHLERHQTIRAAARVARERGTELVRGDAVHELPALMSRAPTNTTLCVYGSFVLPQFTPEMREVLWQRLSAFSERGPVWFISMEGTAEGEAKLRIGEFRDGARAVRQVATAHPHGRWLEWVGDEESTSQPR